MKISRVHYYLIHISLLLILSITFGACSNSTVYTDPYVKDKETIYPQQPDTIIIHSGNNRVKIKMAKPTDPHVRKARIFWFNGTDSVVADFPENRDTLQVKIDSLNREGAYTFKIYTYDEYNNKSVGKTVIGSVYGSKYMQTLNNRDLTAVQLHVGENKFIQLNWAVHPLKSVGTIVKYTNTMRHDDSLYVPPDSDKVNIKNYKLGSTLTYKTLYRPDSTSIDTFTTNSSIAQINQIYLPNTSSPIQHKPAPDGYDGDKYGTPKYWKANEAAKNHASSNGSPIGGYDNGSLAFNTYGFPDIHNGKLYQTVKLPAGSYTYKPNFWYINNNNEKTHYYMVATKGKKLPNISQLGNSLNYTTFENKTLSFDLSEKEEISLGFLATMVGGNNFGINSISLSYSPK